MVNRTYQRGFKGFCVEWPQSCFVPSPISRALILSPRGGSSIHAQFRLPVLNASAIDALVAWVGEVLSEHLQDTQPLAEQDQVTAIASSPR